MASRAGTEQRAGRRTAVALDVVLERRAGRAVPARTVDLGAGGARVTTERPLRVDEELRFDLALDGDAQHLVGTGRVLRQDGHNVYALRFERIEPGCAHDLRAFLEASAAGPLL